MLPLLLIALGAGALVLYMTSDHQKATTEVDPLRQVTDARQATEVERAPQSRPPRPPDEPKRAKPENGRGQYGKKDVQKTEEAAPAKFDRERAIMSLQADLTEANQAKKVAMEVMRRAAATMESQPDSGRIMMTSAQATYAAAEEKARAAEAGLRKLGVSPLDLPVPRRPR